jgi:hypothetical protein
LARTDYTEEQWEAVQDCWRNGRLNYFYYPLQDEWDESFRASSRRIWVAECSRRLGKSVFSVTKAFEPCLRGEGDVRYGAPTQKMVKNIISPIIKGTLLPDCPPELQPKFYQQDGIWEFPTGCVLQVAGLNNGHADDLRGTECVLAVLDEAGFIDDLKYVVEDVLLPQLLTTDGHLMMPSSPAVTPAHDFTGFCVDAEANGSYVHATIYDALRKGHPKLTPDLIAEFAVEVGGEKTSAWKREYLAQRVISEDAAICPEFTEAERFIVERVEDYKRPEYYDAWVIADSGYHDLSAWIFIVWDFKRAVWVVEDELVFRNCSISEQTRAAEAKERELWGDHPVYARYIDASPLVIAEMQKEGRYPIGQVNNQDRDAAVNGLRLAVGRHTIRILDRCKTTIAHLRGGVWNTARTSFARMGNMGHFDAISAAMYAERHVSRSRNPYPPHPDGVTQLTHSMFDVARQAPAGFSAFRSIGSKWRRAAK